MLPISGCGGGNEPGGVPARGWCLGGSRRGRPSLWPRAPGSCSGSRADRGHPASTGIQLSTCSEGPVACLAATKTPEFL